MALRLAVLVGAQGEQGQAESQALLTGFRAVLRVNEGERKAVACPDPRLCPRQDMWPRARVKLPNGWGSKGIDVRLFGIQMRATPRR